MKLANLMSDLEKSDAFVSFKSEFPESFFAVSLCILEVGSDSSQIQLDFFIPGEEKLASFDHPVWKYKLHDDKISGLAAQSVDLKVDLGDLESVVKGALVDNGFSFRLKKIIATLKADVWNCTCMDDMLGIIRMKINAKSGDVSDVSKGSLFEIAQVKGGDLGKKYDAAKDALSK